MVATESDSKFVGDPSERQERDQRMAVVSMGPLRKQLEAMSASEVQSIITNPDALIALINETFGLQATLVPEEQELVYLIAVDLTAHPPESYSKGVECIQDTIVRSGRERKLSVPLQNCAALLLALLLSAQTFLWSKDVHAATPVPTATSQPTATPNANETPKPSAVVLPSPTPTPTATQSPTSTPEVTATPGITVTSGITPTTEITSTQAISETEAAEETTIVVEQIDKLYRQVVVEVANIRQSASTSAEIVTRAPRGTEIEILDTFVDSTGREWAQGTFILIEAGKSTQHEGFVATELLGPERAENSTTYTFGEGVGGPITREQLLEKDVFRADVVIEGGQLLVVDHLGRTIETYDTNGPELVQDYQLLSKSELQKMIDAGDIDEEFKDALRFFPEKFLILNKQGESKWISSNITPSFRMLDDSLQAIVDLGPDFDHIYMEWFSTPQQTQRRGWGKLEFRTKSLQYFLDPKHPLPNPYYLIEINNPRDLAAVVPGDISSIQDDQHAKYYLGDGDFDLHEWLDEYGYFDPEKPIIDVEEFSGKEALDDLVNTFKKMIQPQIEANPELKEIHEIKIRLIKFPQYSDRDEYSTYQTGGVSHLPKNPYQIQNGVLTMDMTAYNPDSMELSWGIGRMLSFVAENYYGVKSVQRLGVYPLIPDHEVLRKHSFSIVKDGDSIAIVPLLIPVSVEP